MNTQSPASVLAQALAQHGIEVLAHQERLWILERGYRVEIESNGLYKLFWNGQVVAPFDDAQELCQFIQLDAP